MRNILLAALLLVTSLAHSQDKQKPFPTKDRIQLLLTQSERAFDTFAQLIEQESQAGDKLAQSAERDRAVLNAARDLLTLLKKSPDGFNSPAGFLLVGDLDDASRNASICMGQAGVESGLRLVLGNTSEALKFQHLESACLDGSTLLYTVSETAYNMYSEFLMAQEQLTNHAVSTAQNCANALRRK